MPLSKIDNYDEVKDTLLRRFELKEDGFKREFRAARPENTEAPQQFIARLNHYFERWLELADVEEGDYEQLKDFMIKDQFLHVSPPELTLFLKEQSPTNDLEKIADLAERFLDARKFARPPMKNYQPTSKSENTPIFREQYNVAENRPKFDRPRAQNGRPSREIPRCWVCDKPGHRIKNCNNRVKLNAMYAEENDEIVLNCEYEMPSKAELGRTQAQPGSLKIETGTVNNRPATVLRDTGCTSIVVRSDLIKHGQLLPNVVSCRLIDGTVKKFPIAVIEIVTPYISGSVKAICIENPISDLIIC